MEIWKPPSGRCGPWLAAGVAMLVGQVAVAPVSATAGAHHRLLPDLTTMRVHSNDLRVETKKTATLLRLTNRVANKGRGPLEIYPSATSRGCDGDGDPDNDRDASQRIFLDANGDRAFERERDTGWEGFKFGCERYDPRAKHWNVFDLARYELRRLHSDRAVAKSSKVSYCTVDSEPVFGELPGSPSRGYYPLSGCDETSILGISVGWADEYYYALPGQTLDVSGLKAGRYCLVSSGDPDNLLRESNNSNNTRKTRIQLRPGKQTVRTLPGPCRIGRRG